MSGTDDLECTCPHGVRSLGRLYGISMGKGTVRLSTATGCPIHDPRTHPFTKPEPKPWHINPVTICALCGSHRNVHDRIDWERKQEAGR